MRTLAQRLARIEPEIERDGAIAWLAPHYGVTRQQDWPLAPLRAAATGSEVGTRYWLRATPVLLEAGADDVRVVGPVTDVSAAQACAFIATLSHHFATDLLAFTAASASDWLVALDHAPALRTRPLGSVIGDRVRPHLATGDDAPRWRRWGQEIEMLLHDHPANGEREQQGRSIVNSVWWQHGGVAPEGSRPAVSTWSDDDDLAALAQHIGARAKALPRDAGTLLESAASIVVADVGAALDFDAVEERFVMPILQALDAGRVASVDVIADAPGRPAVRWRIPRRGWWSRLARRGDGSLAQIVARAEEMFAKDAT